MARLPWLWASRRPRAAGGVDAGRPGGGRPARLRTSPARSGPSPALHGTSPAVPRVGRVDGPWARSRRLCREPGAEGNQGTRRPLGRNGDGRVRRHPMAGDGKGRAFVRASGCACGLSASGRPADCRNGFDMIHSLNRCVQVSSSSSLSLIISSLMLKVSDSEHRDKCLVVLVDFICLVKTWARSRHRILDLRVVRSKEGAQALSLGFTAIDLY